MTEDAACITPEIDYRPFIIADADTATAATPTCAI